MPLLPSLSFDTPGVYVSENQFGSIPASLASFNAVYMLGYSSKAGAPKNEPYFIQSSDDFFNVFGASASTNSVKLFFDQRSGCGLYFVNVPARAGYKMALSAVTPGQVYSLTIDNYTVSYTAANGDGVGTVYSALAYLVNTQLSHIAYIAKPVARPFDLILVNSSVTVTASPAALTLTSVAAGTTPTLQDVITSMSTAFDPDMRQGFLIAPEFFQSFSNMLDRQALANAMEALCSDPLFYWMGIADCGSSVATATTGGGAVNLAIQEQSGLTSPKGHLAYYFPYWVNTSDQQVPMSASVVGVALRRYRDEGYRQPAAGTRYPVYGVKDTTFKLTDKLQAQLNPKGVNCGRKLPAGKGTVIYGARTVSTSPFYRFMNIRVIMNVLAGTLNNAFNEVVFSSVDGQGALFGRIKQTGIAICERLRQAGALFGATPEEAYLVVCDRTNNPALDLENGIVNLDVIVKPSPTLEVLSIRLSRASLGTTLAEVLNSGDASAVNNAGTAETVGNVTNPKNP